MAKKKTFENIISNLLGEPVSNLCHAFYDQYVEANVKFRSRAGMKEVIIRRQLGKCCKWCADLAGIYTPENAPADIYRRHDNCKCMVTYKDEDGYQDVWSKKTYKVEKEARVARERELQERLKTTSYSRRNGSYLRNDLPSKYIDKRKIGENISKSELDAFVEKAKTKGIRLGNDGKGIGNFEQYCGNPKVINDILDQIENLTNEAKRAGLMKQNASIILIYDNVLGYEGKKGVIDVGAFANTKGNTIILNKFMFDDTEFLIKEYDNAVDKRFFAKGTKYTNIVDHEFGHIIDKKGIIRDKLIKILKNEADNAKIPLDEYIKKNISIYSSFTNISGTYNELFPELNSMRKGENREFALEIFRKAGVKL